MLRAKLSAGLTGILCLAAGGCERGDLAYAQAFVARDGAGPVLMVLDHWESGYTRLSDVDLATGARGYPQVIGVDAACLPASTGRIWCGYSTGDAQFAHEEWALGSWDVLADNDSLGEHGGVTSDQIQMNQGVTIRKADRGLAVNAGGGDTYVVDPDSFAVAPWTGYYETDESTPSVPDDAQQGVRAFVDLGGKTYSFDDDGHLQATPTGSSSPTVIDEATTYFTPRFAVTDGYDDASPPLVPDGPESLIIVSSSGQDGLIGWQIARVSTADGEVLWRVDAPDAQSVDTIVGGAGVVAAVLMATPYSDESPPPPRHARVQAIDWTTGDTRWSFAL